MNLYKKVTSREKAVELLKAYIIAAVIAIVAALIVEYVISMGEMDWKLFIWFAIFFGFMFGITIKPFKNRDYNENNELGFIANMLIGYVNAIAYIPYIFISIKYLATNK